jgi:hypothetical protein
VFGYWFLYVGTLPCLRLLEIPCVSAGLEDIYHEFLMVERTRNFHLLTLPNHMSACCQFHLAVVGKAKNAILGFKEKGSSIN